MINFPNLAAVLTAHLPGNGDEQAQASPVESHPVAASTGLGAGGTSPFVALGAPPISLHGSVPNPPLIVPSAAGSAHISPAAQAARQGIIIIGGKEGPDAPPVVPAAATAGDLGPRAHLAQAGIIVIGGRR